MAKKSYDKQEMKEVNEVLDKAIINDETVNVEKTLETKEEQVVVEEIVEEKPKTKETKKEEPVVEKQKEIKTTEIVKETIEENPKVKEEKNKTNINRVFGYTWNGQEFDYI